LEKLPEEISLSISTAHPWPEVTTNDENHHRGRMVWLILPPAAALRPDLLKADQRRDKSHPTAGQVLTCPPLATVLRLLSALRAWFSALPGLREAASERINQPGEFSLW